MSLDTLIRAGFHECCDAIDLTEARREHPADDFTPPAPLARSIEERAHPAEQDTATPWPTTQMNPRYTFDAFVIDDVRVKDGCALGDGQ